MPKLLDTRYAQDVAEIVIDALNDAGYVSTNEAVPGLVQAIFQYADSEGRLREQVLDEAANLLADGSIDEV